MANRSQPRAAGFPLAVAVIAGAVIGVALGQPSAGVVAGFAIGAATALAMWLIDRNKS